MSQNESRRTVRILKACGLNYKQIADLLGIRTGSLYNWLGGWFDLGADKLLKIQELAEKYVDDRS